MLYYTILRYAMLCYTSPERAPRGQRGSARPAPAVKLLAPTRDRSFHCPRSTQAQQSLLNARVAGGIRGAACGAGQQRSDPLLLAGRFLLTLRVLQLRPTQFLQHAILASGARFCRAALLCKPALEGLQVELFYVIQVALCGTSIASLARPPATFWPRLAELACLRLACSCGGHYTRNQKASPQALRQA